MVYQATITTPNSSENYIGATSDPFKYRVANHKSDFKLEHRKHNTTLSTYIWHLKDLGQQPTVTWKVLKKCKTFSPVTNFCQLCNEEKYLIMKDKSQCTLNHRDELFSSCKHKEMKLLIKKTRTKKRRHN